MSIRDDIKRPARRAIHDKFKVPALYLVNPAATPVAVGVRVHTKFQALGDLDGGGAGWAEREEMTPRLIFQRSEMQPARGALVSVEPGEMYRVEVALPPDDEFVTAQVVVLSAGEIAKLFPGGQPVPA